MPSRFGRNRPAARCADFLNQIKLGLEAQHPAIEIRLTLREMLHLRRQPFMRSSISTIFRMASTASRAQLICRSSYV